MEEKRWESCNAEALLEEFFSQDDLRQLALSTGELLGCPLLVLDDTFHIAAHHLPLGFSDALFETAVRRGEISYEAGAIISRNPMLTAGWADYVQLADSPYRRRFAPLVSAGVRLGCLICVDTDGHLEKIPPQTWELVERILAKQLFVEASHQDKPFETAEDILMHLLDGGFSSAAHFQLQASGTYLADFHPLTFALIDLEAYHNAYMGKRHLREELETQIPDAHPFLYKGDIFLFLHREGDADTLSTLAKEFQLKILVSEPLDELFDLRCDFADAKRPRRIAVKTVLVGAKVYRNDISVSQNRLVVGNPVHDHVVHRDAHRSGKSAVTETRRVCPRRTDIPFYQFVHFLGAHARLDFRADEFQCVMDDFAGLPHQIDFAFALYVNHNYLSSSSFAATSANRTSAGASLPVKLRMSPFRV